jgi:DNA-directed RNA polymerase subunit RPC12/RpoP
MHATIYTCLKCGHQIAVKRDAKTNLLLNKVECPRCKPENIYPTASTRELRAPVDRVS